MKNEGIKRKKSIIALSVVAITIVLLGVTVAYFSTSMTVNNSYNTAQYSSEFSEDLTVGGTYSPGEYFDVTDGKGKVTNTGNMAMAVRVKLEDVWKSGNTNLDSTIPDVGEPAAVKVINGDWIYYVDNNNEGWYIYNSILQNKNDETTDLITSIRFNPNASASGTNDYSNASYVLKAHYETIHANAVEAVWGIKFIENVEGEEEYEK